MFIYNKKIMLNISFENIKDQFTKVQSEPILKKYPDKIPLIIWDIHNGLLLDKRKYIVSKDLTIGQFIYVIRKRCKLSCDDGLYMFIHKPDGNVMLPPTNSIINPIFSENNIEGFLRVSISKESTFG